MIKEYFIVEDQRYEYLIIVVRDIAILPCGQLSDSFKTC